MSAELTPCVRCGQCHPQPFREEVLSLYQGVLETETDEKGAAIMELVQEFVASFDSCNHHWDDNIHTLIDQFVANHLRYQQSAMRIGRILMRSLNQYMTDETERMKEQKIPEHLN